MGADPWSLPTFGGREAKEEPEGVSEGMIREAGEEKKSTGNMGDKKGLPGAESTVSNVPQG